jgi:hypothetical protein
MSKLRKAVLLTPLLVATSILPATAQNHNNNSAYYNGMRNGTRGGDYYNNRDPRYNNSYNNRDPRYNNNYNNRDPHYNNNYHNDNRQGGIGPGKGALIGGAGGAALGAVFGGGLKGSLIGGAAGAGIGAVVGQANQNKRNNDNYHRPY